MLFWPHCICLQKPEALRRKALLCDLPTSPPLCMGQAGILAGAAFALLNRPYCTLSLYVVSLPNDLNKLYFYTLIDCQLLGLDLLFL